MGLAASQARLLMLTARKSDLEFQIQLINQRRTVLAYQAANLAQKYANALYQNNDPTVLTQTTEGDETTAIANDNNLIGIPGIFGNYQDPSGSTVPENDIPAGYYEAEMAEVQAIDKALEIRTKSLDTQHKEVETEYDAVKKVIDKNIEVSFKTLG